MITTLSLARCDIPIAISRRTFRLNSLLSFGTDFMYLFSAPFAQYSVIRHRFSSETVQIPSI